MSVMYSSHACWFHKESKHQGENKRTLLVKLCFNISLHLFLDGSLVSCPVGLHCHWPFCELLASQSVAYSLLKGLLCCPDGFGNLLHSTIRLWQRKNSRLSGRGSVELSLGCSSIQLYESSGS